MEFATRNLPQCQNILPNWSFSTHNFLALLMQQKAQYLSGHESVF